MITYIHGMGAGVTWGSLAATVAFVLQLPTMGSDPVPLDALVMLWSVPVVLLSSVIIVALAATFVGLPVVAALERLECDGAEVLALAGALAGLGTIWAIAIAGNGGLGPEERMFALTAAIAGGVTGAAWGRVRDHIAAEQPLPRPTPSANRVDDRRLLR